jgi:collagen type VII alpha
MSLPMDFAAVGAALGPRGDLRLWSCLAGAGKAGEALVQGLARATGADVSVATGLIRLTPSRMSKGAAISI